MIAAAIQGFEHFQLQFMIALLTHLAVALRFQRWDSTCAQFHIMVGYHWRNRGYCAGSRFN